MNPICKQCGTRDVEDDRVCYATPVCFACVPPPAPLPIRRKCRHCIHDEHIGMCTGRNGQTGYVCTCIYSCGGVRVAFTEQRAQEIAAEQRRQLQEKA